MKGSDGFVPELTLFFDVCCRSWFGGGCAGAGGVEDGGEGRLAECEGF